MQSRFKNSLATWYIFFSTFSTFHLTLFKLKKSPKHLNRIIPPTVTKQSTSKKDHQYGGEYDLLNEGSKFVTALLYCWINTITRTLQKCGEEHLNINGRFLLWLGSRKYTINTIATIKNLPIMSTTGSINQSKLKSFQKKNNKKKKERNCII